MKKIISVASVFFLLVICFAVWFMIASDYGDSVVSGTYRFNHGSETSILVLKPDHTFQQTLSRSGSAEHAIGTWRHLGEAGIAFSKEFWAVSGEELVADGTAYGEMHKALGLFPVYLTLSTYDIEWYGRTDPSPANTVSGAYAGDEEGVPATLVIKSDHTFEQSVTHANIAKHAQGGWGVSQNGDIYFSNAFIKTTGETLRNDETASAWDPKGSNLQIQIAVISTSGAPTFRKKQFLW